MATITKAQYEKRQATAPSGWQYDFRHYVMWGENQLTRRIDFPDGSVVMGTVRWEDNYENQTFPSGYSFPKYNGTVSPVLTVAHWHETRPGSDVWMSTGAERREKISEQSFPRKNYKELCKFAATVPDSRIMELYSGKLQQTT